ncbi:MAG: phospholipase D family protein [Proteobacteria bacterium]|nr:phospholipase D family protein [Pseudomonadota bacterium]
MNNSALEAAIAPLAAAHPGLSGIHPLPDGLDAFAVRAWLASVAGRTLDVQYYIWDDDKTGTLLFNALRAAADRGVRVRLLLDDHNTAGLDETLAQLDTHPNLEVRLFNPLRIRRPRWINYLFDFARVNRRMHNKSITADAVATIVGGRNISDKYFDATDEIVFADLDVLAVGPVARDVAADFESYWNSVSACPARRLLPRPAAPHSARVAGQAAQLERSPEAAAYVRAVHELACGRQLLRGQLALEWAPVRLLSDAPAKARGRAGRRQQMSFRLDAIVGDSVSSFDLVSAYFVPTARGVAALAQLARRGVAIRILTNSLAATDVAAVHAGYARRRKPLLRAGIGLFEWRLAPHAAPRHKRVGLGSGSGRSAGKSSAASLHAKTFSVDGRGVFIGSFNFDPRSARLNTELGVIIDSPALAGRIEAGISERMAQAAWKVSLSPAGELRWSGERDRRPEQLDVEPQTRLYQRLGVWLLSLLPIEWLL